MEYLLEHLAEYWFEYHKKVENRLRELGVHELHELIAHIEGSLEYDNNRFAQEMANYAKGEIGFRKRLEESRKIDDIYPPVGDDELDQ